MFSISIFMENFGIDPLAQLDAMNQMDQIQSGELENNSSNEPNVDDHQKDSKKIMPGLHDSGRDENGPFHWVKVKDDVARGEWEGHYKNLSDYPLNVLNTINARGDLYQKEYLPGAVNPGPDPNTPKVVRFEDGTEYEYSPHNEQLMKKMYSRKNVIPDWDPLDFLSMGTAAAGKMGISAFSKMGSQQASNIMTHLPSTHFDNVATKILDHIPGIASDGLTKKATSFGLSLGGVPFDTYNRRYIR